MKTWKYLKPGDLIDLVAPGSPCTQDEFKLGVQYLEQKGFKVRFPLDLFTSEVPFHSSSDQKRFEHLKAAIMAKDSKAIWCLRGGYGSNRLVADMLKLKPTQSKLFIGISDITSLHLVLNLKWDWSSLHGPLLDRVGTGRVPKELETELWDLLTGRAKEQVFADLHPLNPIAHKQKKLSANILGGNLAVIQSMIGTALKPNFKEDFLFLEDIGERGYRLDKMFYHLRTGGVLAGVKAVFFGHFTGGEEPDGKESLAPYALQRFANDVGIPVFAGIQSGHGAKLRALPLNSPATLQFKNNLFQLTIKSGGK
jgi:muramoyltetrapeptide carboxypeptidase